MSRLRIVVVDNYDSFTWNLVQVLYGEGREVIGSVRRQARIDLVFVVLTRYPHPPSPRGVSAPRIHVKRSHAGYYFRTQMCTRSVREPDWRDYFV